MSKKTNTVVFILVATLFNVIVTILSFIILLVLYSKFIYPLIPESILSWIMPVLFIASIVISYLVYKKVIKILMKRMNIDDYFDPLFGPRRPTGKR